MSLFGHWHKLYSWEMLKQRLWAMPMLLVVIPFIAGILLANSVSLPLWFVCGALVVAIVGTIYARPMSIAYSFAALLCMLFGVFVTELRQPSSSTPYDIGVEMHISIISPISERDGYRVADGRIERWQDDNGCYEADDRVRLWLRTDSLAYGDRVHIVGELREQISKYEDYNALMHNRGYVGGVGIGDELILDIEHNVTGGMRRYAIEKLGRYARDTASHSVVEGMVVGSRHNMQSTLREQYSATGLSHILAVSGLHLGIITLIISMLLAPLKLLPHGHIIADIMTVAVLWLFVVISGASPSVVRAALMFSVLILVRNSTGHYSPINALAFTIFLMLCYNPQTLYDISFQLSVLAVIGIVEWGAPAVRSIRVRSHLVCSLISTVIIGVVATLWTLPVVSVSFGNIPLIGVIATPVVLIIAYAIVGCGVLALALPCSIAGLFASVAEWFASVQNIVVGWFSALPYASLQLTMSSTVVVLYYLILVVVTLSFWALKPETQTLASDLSQIVGEVD